MKAELLQAQFQVGSYDAPSPERLTTTLPMRAT